MSWRGRDDARSTRGDKTDVRWEIRGRSPVWESRRSVSPDSRISSQRDRHRQRNHRDRDRRDHDSDRLRMRDRYDRNFDRCRSPRRHDDREEDMPSPPAVPTISAYVDKPVSLPDHSDLERSNSSSGNYESKKDKQDDQSSVNASSGDWFCVCGSYNFKRRQECYRHNCQGKRSEGIVYGGDEDKKYISESSGITKQLLFRRLDALTTEEKILESMKQQCSKLVIDSIAGIKIGRETLTGVSKCLAYINFNSIADSIAAHTELMSIEPPLKIDGREVLISYYYEPQKRHKPANSNLEYSNYYAQMTNYSTSQALSEADRVNVAAAVAQSAITATQARHMAWTPVSVPVFIASNKESTPAFNIPSGDGKTKYNPPDVKTFMYDETSGYYYDPATALYYDSTSQYFYNSRTKQYMYWDVTRSTYILVTQNQQDIGQAQLPNVPQATTDCTIAKEPAEKKKKLREDKVKVAKKIAKDMERWARTLNQKKKNARNNFVMEQSLDTGPSIGSADIGFSVLGASHSLTHVRELSPPRALPDDFLMKTITEPVFDNDEGIIDWVKLSCLLCKRLFPSAEVLTKHKTLSDLHKQNLVEHQKNNELLSQPNAYRDRAAERRLKFGEDDTPIKRKQYEPSNRMPPPVFSAPPPSVVDTIGGKMLQKMGWSHGRGLGKEEQGRIAPIEAEQRPSLSGLGQKKGIYTPSPGETYRDTVKKLMISRYKEVVGQEEGNK